MSDEQPTSTAARKDDARFSSRERGVLWFAGSALTTAGVAWGAYQFQQRGMAPALIFPLLVGAILGLGLAGLARLTRFSSRTIQFAAAVAWGLLAVFGQDYIGYRDDLRRHNEQAIAREKAVSVGIINPDDPRLIPPTLISSTINRIHHQPVMWSLDLVLTIVASAGVVWFNPIPPKEAESLAKH